MKNYALCFAFAMIVILGVTLSADSPKQQFSLTVAAPKEPLKVGMELHLLVTVTNVSNHKISFITSPGSTPEDGLLYRINARDAKGQPAPPSAAVRNRDKRVSTQYLISRTTRTLKPGESFVEQVTITDFFDLSEPGAYTVSVARDIPPHQNLGHGSVESNSVTITVAP